MPAFPIPNTPKKACAWRRAKRCWRAAEVVLQVRSPGANPEAGAGDLALFRRGQVVIGFGEPLTALDAARDLARAGVTFLAMELMPRITRAQSMDALSSMATIAGYKAVLIAADSLPRMFPMLMTAAGTVAPARVLVIGAGVAGLQAIATARRLGAVVSGYDIRAAVKEQIESLGARFVVLDVQPTRAEDKGGYAKAMGEDFYRRQREADGRRAGRTERGDHHRGRARKESAHPDHARDGGAHGAGLGDCGHRRRARRQLRTDATRRNGGSAAASAFSGRSTCRPPFRITPARCTPRISPRF